MARQTFNRRVTTLDSGKQVTDPTNAPAVESENARFDQIGPLRKANLAINLAAVALTAGGVDADAPVNIVAGRAGEIVGIAYGFSAAIAAGGAPAAPLPATVNGPAKGDLFSIASGGAQAAVLNETAGDVTSGPSKGAITFQEGDLLSVAITTNGTFAPTTDDVQAYLLVRWAA